MTPQFGASLTDYARIIVYDHILITQGTDVAWYKTLRMGEKNTRWKKIGAIMSMTE